MTTLLTSGSQHPAGANVISFEDFMATRDLLAARARRHPENPALLAETEALVDSILVYHAQHPDLGAWILMFCEQVLDDVRAGLWDGVSQLLAMMGAAIERHKNGGRP